MIYKTFVELNGHPEQLFNERDTDKGNDLDDVIVDFINCLADSEATRISIIINKGGE
jgi:hypothetical protein